MTKGKDKLEKTVLERLEKYDEMNERNIEILTKLTNSNVLRASTVKVPADPLNSKRKSQYSVTHINESRFTINPQNPKTVKMMENC